MAHIGSYICYGKDCQNRRPGKDVIQLAVLLPPGSPRELQYLCPTCLDQAVEEGRLILRPGHPDAETTTDSIAVPVTTNDDGSVSVGDIEIRW